MTNKARVLCAALALGLLGCQGKSGEPAAPTEARKADAPEAPDAAAETPAEGEPEMVWADAEFLDAAGVKEGKDVIYLPTPPMVAAKMVEMANVTKDDLVFDLGTGDGRIAIAAAKMTGCKAIGYELDDDFVKIARENVRKEGLEHLVTIEQADVLEVDFSSADVVLMFLNPDLNVALLPQFEKLKPGARIVSHDFDMKGEVEPDEVIADFRSELPDFVNVHNLYLWKAPLRRAQP